MKIQYKPLFERNFETKTYIVEDKESHIKNYYLEGITIQTAIINENNREYSVDVISPALERYLAKFKLGKNTFACLDHPGVSAEDANYVNPKEVGGMFVELNRDGNNYHTKSLVMDTPNGKIVKAFIDAGAILGISTRGFGDFAKRDSDGVDVVTDYEFITLGDYVTDPSAPDAYLQAVMEHRNWIYDIAQRRSKNKIAQHIDVAEKKLKATSSKNLNEEAIKFFAEYMKLLLNK